MKTAFKTALFLICVCAAALLRAQSERTSGTSAPKAPPPERAVSARASAAILADVKPFTPPPPPKAAGEEDEEVDLRDVDKPKNEIVRLPKYTVTAKKPPVFTERDFYSESDLKKLAMARYLSRLDAGLLNRWTIPGLGMSNEDRAMQMYLEDERLKNMEATRQNISALRASGETERADAAQKDYYDTFLRRRDAGQPDSLRRQQGR